MFYKCVYTKLGVVYYIVVLVVGACTIQFTSTTRQGDVAKHLKKTFIFCPFRLAAMGKLFKVSTTSYIHVRDLFKQKIIFEEAIKLKSLAVLFSVKWRLVSKSLKM